MNQNKGGNIGVAISEEPGRIVYRLTHVAKKSRLSQISIKRIIVERMDR